MDANRTANMTLPPEFNVFCDLDEDAERALRFVLVRLMPRLYLTILVVGLPLNFLSFWLFHRRLRPWTRSTLFLYSLALADTSWLLALPFLIRYHQAGMRWPFGSAVCRVVRLLYHNYFYLSIFFVTCLSFDRYLAIVHPMRSSALLTRQRALKVCLAIWVLTVLMSYPVFYMSTAVPCLNHNWTVCNLYALLSDTRMSLPYSMCCTCVGFLFPFSALSYCYLRSVLQLRGLGDPRLRALAVDLGAAVALFGAFYLPYHLSRNAAVMMRALKINDLPAWRPADLSFTIDMCVCSLSSCVNPLLGFFTGTPLCPSDVSDIWRWRCRVTPEGTGEPNRGGPSS